MKSIEITLKSTEITLIQPKLTCDDSGLTIVLTYVLHAEDRVCQINKMVLLLICITDILKTSWTFYMAAPLSVFADLHICNICMYT